MALTQQNAAAIAKSIVVVLCGSRWVNPPAFVADKMPLPQSGRLVLAGRPVIEVDFVKVDGDAVDESKWELSNGFVIHLDPSIMPGLLCSSACGDRVEVQYLYGYDRLPKALQRAIDELAAQLLLADSGSNQCRLPQRVTSVSRQGVSWTMIDPQDFLEQGRTGLYYVDLAIKTYNPGNARRRARVFTFDVAAPPRRRQA